jgi:hypothetical protein
LKIFKIILRWRVVSEYMKMRKGRKEKELFTLIIREQGF